MNRAIKYLFSFRCVALLCAMSFMQQLSAQTLPFYGDSSRFSPLKNGAGNEIIIESSTKNIHGALVNYANGRTHFVVVVDTSWALNDSTTRYHRTNGSTYDITKHSTGSVTVETDPVWTSEKTNYFTKTESDARFLQIGAAAGGDLSGTYPNPTVVWSNGFPTYDLRYASLLNSDFIASGGIVTWISGYTYNVSPAVYYINGVRYTSPSTNITLSAADATFDRIDVFALTTSGTAIAVTGTPTSNPEKPDIDNNTQIEASFAVVEHATTQPTINQEWIYRENADWTTAVSNASINPNSTNSPFAGSKDVEGTAVANTHNITYTRATTLNISTFSNAVLSFEIKSKASWSTNKKFVLQWFNGTTAVGNAIPFGDQSYGFVSSSTSSYFLVSIPLKDFGALSTVTKLRMQAANTSGTFGFFIDNIQIQSVTQTGTTETDPIADAKTITITPGIGMLGSVSTQTLINNPSFTTNIDTFAISTRAWRQKLADSLGSIIGTKLSAETDPVATAKTVSVHPGYGIIIPETQTQALSANPSHTPTVDTFAISTRAWRQKLADSLGPLIHATSLDTVNVANALAWSVDNTGAALVNSNAINMLNNSTKNKFYFPAGNYKVSCVSRTGSSQTNHQGILITRDSIEIYIDPKANFTADTAVTATTGASGNSKAYPVFNLLGVKHVKIIGGGQIKGQRNSQGFYNTDPNNDPLGYIADTSNRWSVSGVQIKDCNDIEIAGLSINSMQMDGVLVMNSTNIYVHDARTDTVGGSGFHVLRSSANVRFERCVADSSNSDNLRVDSSVYGNIYFVECAGVKAGRSSTSSNWFAGIYVNQSSHVHVNNCNLSKNSAYGYDNPSDSTIYKDNTLTNSTISYNGNGGAVINGNETITDNWFINNGKLPDGATDTHSNYNPAAIVVNDASNATIENNHFYDTGWVANPYGIKHWAGAAGSKIYRSKIKNNIMRGYADLAHAQDAIDATCEVDNSVQTSTGAPVDATTNGNVWTYSTTNHAAGWAASAGGGSGATTVGSFNTTATANGLDISGSTIALHAADATNAGAFKASGAQTVGISNLKISNNTASAASAQDQITLAGTNYGYMSLNASNASSNLGIAFEQGSAAGSANNRFYSMGVRGTNADANYGLNGNGGSTGDFVLHTFFSSAFRNVFIVPSGTQNFIVSGNVGLLSQSNLTNAQLNFFAGSATLAPIKLVTGTLLTTPVAGTLEYLTPNLWFTNNDLIRQEIPQIQQSVVSTQFDKTSSTALANVTGLTASLFSPHTYRFEALIYTTSNVAGGVQFAIDYTGTTPTFFIAEAVVLDANVNAAQTRTTTKGTAIGGVTAVTNALCKITGTISTSNTGNLTVKFAQNASNGTASSVLVGSTFVVTEIN